VYVQCIASSQLEKMKVKALETKLSVFPIILVKLSCIAWLAVLKEIL